MKRVALLVGITVFLVSGCSRTELNRTWDYRTDHIVTVFNADGSVRHIYYTQGKVTSEANSDGWFFTDQADHKLTMVTGFVEVKTADR